MNQENTSVTDLEKINTIINEDIRPFLQRDGGDLKIISFDDNVLKIHYEGACGGCPHATMGTLRAIENVLREKFNPEIVVQPE